ncbi:MAG: PLP-dependent aminotransferase family protein [Syntrophomonadaceae bacterium]|nr:PLP-dependent aminotransferase family protein [Syntrophomonadaceae bacterium]MDD3022827.1 PLP-dependent aminotransferase family protein [Syntrophomonadaceae bacterium]
MLGIKLERNSQLSLARQIYQAMREQMMRGQLEPGEVLPSTRELAKQLAVSRNTAYEAYDMLFAEGFTLSRPGSSTRVASGLRLEKTSTTKQPVDMSGAKSACWKADFRTGRPELRCFPQQLWLQLLHRAAHDMPLKQWSYSGPEGLPILREEIAAWLFRSKGLEVDPRDIFITAGATQALHLLADILFQEGKKIIVEDPCHLGMLRVLQGKGLVIIPVPVDQHGLKSEFLDGEGVGAAYITPSHQFPLGGILPASRRAALLRLSREYNFYIIEDDYDSEFRYEGAPVAPLYSMDSQQVIYVGTFSKILFPALRIGYLILPYKMQEQWRYLRTHADVQNPPFEQAALAEYLRSRKLDRHIRKMRKIYGDRRRVLLSSLEECFSKGWRAWGDAAGLHLALEFPGRSFDRDFAARAREYGICITPADYHSISKGMHLDKIILGYGHLDNDEIRAGIRLLHDFMEEHHLT